MAKKRKRKKARSKRSNPSTKKTRRRKKRRNPSFSAAPKRRRKRRKSRKARRNPASRASHAPKKGRRRKRRKNPAGVIMELAKAAGVGLLAAGVVGVGTFVVAQKISKGSNVLPANTLRMVQAGAILAGLGAGYFIATKGKSPLLGAAAAAGAIGGGVGPEIAHKAITMIATQQQPAAAAQQQATTNGIGALALRQGGMGALALRGMGAVDNFAEPTDF